MIHPLSPLQLRSQFLSSYCTRAGAASVLLVRRLTGFCCGRLAVGAGSAAAGGVAHCVLAPVGPGGPHAGVWPWTDSPRTEVRVACLGASSACGLSCREPSDGGANAASSAQAAARGSPTAAGFLACPPGLSMAAYTAFLPHDALGALGPVGASDGLALPRVRQTICLCRVRRGTYALRMSPHSG